MSRQIVPNVTSSTKDLPPQVLLPDRIASSDPVNDDIQEAVLDPTADLFRLAKSLYHRSFIGHCEGKMEISTKYRKLAEFVDRARRRRM